MAFDHDMAFCQIRSDIATGQVIFDKFAPTF